MASDFEDTKDEAKEDYKDDTKEEPVARAFQTERKPKPDPGDGLPKKTPEEIQFTWNPEFKQLKQCDTLHTLYLLQEALELVRKRTIERNKYFASISRTDRYINQLDAPQVISNFLEWHNQDTQNNQFDGELLKTKPRLFIINDVISGIGGMKKGPATKVLTKLIKNVQIGKTWIELPPKKFKLKTWGWTRFDKSRKELADCSVDEVCTLIFFDRSAITGSDEKNENDVEFTSVLQSIGSAALGKLTAVDEWKAKLAKFLQKNSMNGQKILETRKKDFGKECSQFMVGDAKLNGALGKVLEALKTCPVHDLLKQM